MRRRGPHRRTYDVPVPVVQRGERPYSVSTTLSAWGSWQTSPRRPAQTRTASSALLNLMLRYTRCRRRHPSNAKKPKGMHHCPRPGYRAFELANEKDDLFARGGARLLRLVHAPFELGAGRCVIQGRRTTPYRKVVTHADNRTVSEPLTAHEHSAASRAADAIRTGLAYITDYRRPRGINAAVAETFAFAADPCRVRVGISCGTLATPARDSPRNLHWCASRRPLRR